MNKEKLIGKYRAHSTRAGALLEARRIALDLPGIWKGSAYNINYDYETPEWLPACIHLASKARLTRGSREWYCVPKHIQFKTEFSKTPLMAVRKMLSALPKAYREERLEIEKKLIDLRAEEMALAKIKAAMRS